MKSILEQEEELRKYLPTTRKPLFQFKSANPRNAVDFQKWQQEHVEIDPLFFRDIGLNSIPASRSEEGNNYDFFISLLIDSVRPV
jgi:hypothetical protein